MILALVLLSICLAIQPSLSFPSGIGAWADTTQGFDISTDFDAYYGPYNYGNRWWSGLGGLSGGLGGLSSSLGGLTGGSRGLYSYDGYVDNVDYDYSYSYPIRTIDVGRERNIRDIRLDEVDTVVRDQSIYRSPTRYRSYVYPTRRVVYSSGLGGPRTSSLRTGGDLLYLRR